METSMNNSAADSISTLNELLRGEMSAVETYAQALEKIEEPFMAREEVRRCQADHQSRVGVLKNAIVNLGGKPSESSGLWGTFAKMVEGGAKVLGSKMAIAALEEGEDHGLALYQKALKTLDLSSRALVDRDLFPGQQKTHEAVRGIKRILDV